MFILMENINPFKNVYEYLVFRSDSEINCGESLFSVKVYYLESEHYKIANELDINILDFQKFLKTNEVEKDIVIAELKKCVFEELRELNIDSDTKLNISIIEG
ncbi:MAG: hypothetical protein ACRC76_09665 [Proteocatella sp.]